MERQKELIAANIEGGSSQTRRRDVGFRVAEAKDGGILQAMMASSQAFGKSRVSVPQADEGLDSARFTRRRAKMDDSFYENRVLSLSKTR